MKVSEWVSLLVVQPEKTTCASTALYCIWMGYVCGTRASRVLTESKPLVYPTMSSQMSGRVCGSKPTDLVYPSVTLILL